MSIWGRDAKPRPAHIPSKVRDWEIDKGGWRYDENDDSYYLNWDQLLEYERKNDVIRDDGAFWDWFREYRESQHITGRKAFVHRGATPAKSWDDWDDEGWTQPTKKKDGWYSSWWAKDVYKGWSGASGSVDKLAIGLQAIRSVVRVVDDNVPPMTVSWATDAESYTDFKRGRIVVNPKPVTDGKLEDGHAIDVTTGFALHEAGHSQYSREPYDNLTKPTELAPMQVAGILLNIVEDVRIEAAIVDDYPGFAGYFQRALDWVWGETKKGAPKTYGPDLKSKVNACITICRWPKQAAEVLKDASFAAEIPWWTNWRDDYLEGRVGARETIERGLDHLREPTEQEKKDGKDENSSEAGQQMDQMAKDEEAMKKAMGDLKAFIDEAIRKGLAELAEGRVCAAHDAQKNLPETAARKVQELVESEVRHDRPTVKAPDETGQREVRITHPPEDGESKRSYIGKPAAIVQRLKAALVFRQELPRWNERLMKEGDIDDDELWRFGAKDYRVFHEEHIVQRPKVQLGMLVDMSGSMSYGSKLPTAQELAQLLLTAARDMDGVHPVIHGHTGDRGVAGADVFRIWEEGEPITRLGLIQSLYHGNNYDGFAIEYCVKDLLKRGMPDEQRVLLVLSDGYPAGDGYGGMDAELHVRRVVDWADKQGVSVIQIAIDEAMRPDDQARMFKHWVQFRDMQSLPKQLTKLLERII